MSALFRGVCYPNLEGAKQQACSSLHVTWGDGSSVYTVECTSTDFSQPLMDVCKRRDGGPCEAYTSAYPVFQDCDFSGGVDLALEWMYLVLPVVVGLWGIKKLINLFSENREDA